MTIDDSTWHHMKTELEKILGRDRKFGPLHRLELVEDEQLILAWDAEMRQKAKSMPSAYLQFIETVADCLSDYGFCLEADEEAQEPHAANYLLITPEDESEDDEA